MTDKRPVILTHKFALGDTVCFTALARDIELAFPGRFELIHHSHYNNIWGGNPNIRRFKRGDDRLPGVISAKISYKDGIIRAGRGEKLHMLQAYHLSFQAQTGFSVPLTQPKGDLYLTDDEKKPVVEGKYWVLLAGGKEDATVKVWRPELWQQTVNKLRDRGIWCVQAGIRSTGNFHPKLDNVIDLVDRFHDARQLAGLISNAQGVLCPITAAMHMAACFDKPCVVVAGGREEPWWEGYTNDYGAFGPKCAPVKVPHRFLHTIGQLHCCEKKGCWKHRTVPLGRRDDFDTAARLCKLPVMSNGQHGPKCLDLISPEMVVEAVASYGQGEQDRPQPREAKNNMSLVPEKPVVVEDVSTIKPVVIAREITNKLSDVPGPIDHPIIGGRYTLFVLCYGDHTDLAQRCLDSILATVHPSRLDIRVACNAVAPATLRYLESIPTTKIYDFKENRHKYTVMREIFRDPEHPINTNYLIWFDDDTKIVEPKWLDRLSEVIAANHLHGNRLYGWRMQHDLSLFRKGSHDPSAWFRAARWWQGRSLKARGTLQDAPNGTVIEFVPGWHWAMATEMIKKADIPDARLVHNGGDITIGAAVTQAGGKIKQWNRDKAFVWCPTKQAGGRRGYSEAFPWADPGTKAKHVPGA